MTALPMKRLLLFGVLVILVSAGLMQVAVAAPVSQQAQFVAPKLVVNASFLNVRSGPGVEYTVLLTVVGGTELPVVGQASDGVWFQVATAAGVGWVNVQFTLPRGSFANVPVVSTADIAANALPVGAMPVTLGLGQGGGATPSSAASTSPQLGAPLTLRIDAERSITVYPGERFRALIGVEAVNLRTRPFDGAPVLTTLFRTTSKVDYAVLGFATDRAGVSWVAIDVSSIGVGWIETSHAQLRLSRVSGTVVVVLSQLRLTATPGGSSDNLPLVNNGSEGFLRDISGDSQFVKIELADGTMGWLPFSAVSTRTGTPSDLVDLSGIQAVTGFNEQPGQGGGAAVDVTAGPHVVVNTGFLNIRSGPGAQFTILETVPGGTRLAADGITRDGFWFLVSGSFGQGWINSEFVVFRGVIGAVPIASQAVGSIEAPVGLVSGSVTVYAAPGVNFGVIGTVVGPVELPIVAQTADGVWLQVNSQIGFGWVLSSQMPVRGNLGTTPVIP